MILTQAQFLFAAILCPFVLAYILTPLAMVLGRRLGMVDLPGGRKQHEGAIPRSGGLALFAAFHLSLALFSFLLSKDEHPLGLGLWTFQVQVSSLLVLATGLIDDRWQIRPIFKLLGQILAAATAWAVGLRLARLGGVDLPDAVDFAATVLLYVAAMNAYNLIDGMDGVAGGLGAVTGFGLAGLFLLMGSLDVAIASLILSGACLGFLRYNFHPARVFLGDTGSMMIGFLLICITLSTNARSAATVMMIVPLLALGVPLLDTGLAIWRRSVRKAMNPNAGNRVSQGDRDHLHHRLARKGLTQRRVALLLYAIQATVFVAGILMVTLQNYRIAIFSVAFFAGSYVLLKYLAGLEMTDSGRWIVDGIRKPEGRKVLRSLMPLFDVAILFLGLLILYGLTRGNLLNLKLGTLLKECVPTLIAFPVILIYATRYYRPMWSRARPMDYLYLTILCVMGILLGMAFTPIPSRHGLREASLLVLAYLALVMPALIALRVFPRLVQDIFHYHERRRIQGGDPSQCPRVLMYGAGYAFTLLARAESFDSSPQRRPYHVVGLIDDNEFLTGKLVHGHRVLGTLAELPDLIGKEKISEIVITTRLREEKANELLRAARVHHLKVSQWLTTNRILYDPKDGTPNATAALRPQKDSQDAKPSQDVASPGLAT